MRFNRNNPLKIGTRGSPLAMAQAYEARDRLMAALGLDADVFQITVISVTGDRIQDRPLSAVGGKGLFTKEIEEALLDASIDIAVHSMKDMPVDCPAGLTIECYLPREDVRDAFVSRKYKNISDLPQGAVVGSSSLRRRAQIAQSRPDIKLVEFRGNVQTRLRKLDEGVADATFLAMAGLNRLGMAEIANPIETDRILPAVAQGCIGIEQRAQDADVTQALALINDAEATVRLAAERAFLAGLDGSCQTPIAGLAELDGDTLHLRGEVIRPDGSERLTYKMSGQSATAAAMGSEMATVIRAQMGDGFFDE